MTKLQVEPDQARSSSTLRQFARREASGWQLWLLSGNPKLTRVSAQGIATDSCEQWRH